MAKRRSPWATSVLRWPTFSLASVRPGIEPNALITHVPATARRRRDDDSAHLAARGSGAPACRTWISANSTPTACWAWTDCDRWLSFHRRTECTAQHPSAPTPYLIPLALTSYQPRLPASVLRSIRSNRPPSQTANKAHRTWAERLVDGLRKAINTPNNSFSGDRLVRIKDIRVHWVFISPLYTCKQ